MQGAGGGIQGSGFRVQGAGFRVHGSGWRVQGWGCHRPHRQFVLVRPGRYILGCLEKRIKTAMAQGQSTKIISMIKWIWTSKLSIKNYLSFLVRIWGSGGGVQGSGLRVQGSGCRVQGTGYRVQGAGSRVQGSGCRVQGAGSRVEG